MWSLISFECLKKTGVTIHPAAVLGIGNVTRSNNFGLKLFMTRRCVFRVNESPMTAEETLYLKICFLQHRMQSASLWFTFTAASGLGFCFFAVSWLKCQMITWESVFGTTGKDLPHLWGGRLCSHPATVHVVLNQRQAWSGWKWKWKCPSTTERSHVQNNRIPTALQSSAYQRGFF